jgi:hypothetical protein
MSINTQERTGQDSGLNRKERVLQAQRRDREKEEIDALDDAFNLEKGAQPQVDSLFNNADGPDLLLEAPSAPTPIVEHRWTTETKVTDNSEHLSEIGAKLLELQSRLSGDAQPEVSHDTPIEVQADTQQAEPIEVHVETKKVDQSANQTPEKADETAPLSRKDFVKQQNELWGAYDDVKAEDVPEGELTYDQYLAQRPVAQKGDSYHMNGKARDAVSGNFMEEVKYENAVATTNNVEHYEKLADDEILRNKAEGKLLVESDPRLKDLLSIGEEMRSLYGKKAESEDFENEVKPQFDAKKEAFDVLRQHYQDKGLDERALDYIYDKTAFEIDNPGAAAPVEGSPYLNGEKVTILEYVEQPKGQRSAYTIEKADGSIEAVYTDEVSFKREFAQPENSTEVEPAEEEELSKFDRAKKWFEGGVKKLQAYAGNVYWGTTWNQPGTWFAERGITEGMSFEEVQKQKLKNRTNSILGRTAAVVVAAILIKNGNDFLMGLDNAPLFESAPATPEGPIVQTEFGNGNSIPDSGTIASVDNAEGYRTIGAVPSFFESGAAAETPSDAGIDNAAYDIPESGTGIGLFDKLELGADKWNQNAQTLADRFPNDFYREGSDVRIAHPGMLSAEARQFIESLR